VVAALVCVAAVSVGNGVGMEAWRLSRRRTIGALAGCLAVVAVGIAALASSGAIARTWDDFRHPVFRATDTASRLGNVKGNRSALWSVALHEFDSHPLKGIGSGTYEFAWTRGRGRGFVRDAHSLYIEQLAETGLPGLLLLLGALGGVGWLAVRGRRRSVGDAETAAWVALAAAFVVFLFHAGIDWVWEVTAVAVFGLAAGGLAALPGFSGRIRLRPIPRLVMALVAAIAIGVQIPGLASTSLVRKSQAELRRGSLSVAAEHADDAVSTEPWAATPYLQRALVSEARGNLVAAVYDVGRATNLEPANWRYPLVLARLSAEGGNPRAALHWFRVARRLRPDSPFTGPRYRGP
jgi:O-Antigen ligase